MALSILGGKGKGHVLKVPTKDYIRPMSVLLKRKLFDSRQNLEGFRFFDLCAGSGAVGLEAWSRGAERVFFTEIDRKVHPITKENLKKIINGFKLENETLLLRNQDCLKFLKQELKELSGEKSKDMILFFAPPYPQHKLYEKVLGWLDDQLWYQGEIWVESCNDKGIKESKIIELLGSRTERKHIKQGSSFLKLF